MVRGDRTADSFISYLFLFLKLSSLFFRFSLTRQLSYLARLSERMIDCTDYVRIGGWRVAPVLIGDVSFDCVVGERNVWLEGS